MEVGRTARAANVMCAAVTPLLMVGGLALAGCVTVFSVYVVAAGDVAAILWGGTLTLVALCLPIVFLASYDGWQVKHGLYSRNPNRATRTLRWACLLFGTLLLVPLTAPLALLSVVFAVVAGSDGMPAVSIYYAVVALAVLAEPVAFLYYYDRWRARNGLT